MATQRATWIGDTQIPATGAEGSAWPADGFNDPESLEYGAYLFLPDNEDPNLGPCYCDPRLDLDFSISQP